MASISTVFLVIALVCFLLGAANPPIAGGRVNLESLGLAFATLAFLFKG
jgi:hypothetical protein